MLKCAFNAFTWKLKAALQAAAALALVNNLRRSE